MIWRARNGTFVRAVAAIAVVAASTPILINIVKPLVKQIFSKLTKKKDIRVLVLDIHHLVLKDVAEVLSGYTFKCSYPC